MSSAFTNRAVLYALAALAALIIVIVGVELSGSSANSVLLQLSSALLAALIIVLSFAAQSASTIAPAPDAKQAEQDAALADALPRLSPILQSVSQTVSNQLQAISSYSDVLSSASDRLTLDGSEENVRSIISNLIDENRSMKAAAEAAKSELQSKSMEITFLRRDLELARRDADTDPLTQIANRRHMMEVLESRVAGKSEGNSFCLALLDIDHFKSINDTHGHPVGDLVLKTYAHEISRLLRGRDLVARYGGEEFMILLNNVTLEQAAVVIERVRSKLCTINWKSLEGCHSINQVTSSIGLAQWSKGEPIDRLIERTDALLYKAKSQGRDRVVSA